MKSADFKQWHKRKPLCNCGASPTHPQSWIRGYTASSGARKRFLGPFEVGSPQILPAGVRGGASARPPPPRVTGVPSAHLQAEFSAPLQFPPLIPLGLPSPICPHPPGLAAGFRCLVLTLLPCLASECQVYREVFLKEKQSRRGGSGLQVQRLELEAGEDLPRVQGQPELHNEASKPKKSS